MSTINQTKTAEVNPEINFEVLSQGFENGNFYGLEYILEDFFQSTKEKPSVPAKHSVDWFGLNT
jgi:hypothetical protein